jgi:hypothetical protein
MLREQKRWQVQPQQQLQHVLPQQQYCRHYSLPPMTTMTAMMTGRNLIYPRKI